MLTKDKERPFRIVVLDDLLPTRRLTAMLLKEKLGCEVLSYDDSFNVLELPESKLPDLYLLDIFMDRMSGLELCARLKAKPLTQDIPVIFFSAHATPQTRVEALNAGAVDYLDKPFYPEELIARVRMHIVAYQQAIQIAHQVDEQRALLRVLCHDLQNPLAATFSMLELQELDSEIDAKDVNQMMRSALKSSLDLVAHVREYRRLIDLNRPYELREVDLTEAVQESVGIMQALSSPKKIKLELKVEDEVVVWVNRVVLVHNIINNLLSNAIKFSHEASTVEITIRQEKQGQNRFGLVEICDHGVGISEEVRCNLFDPVRNLSRVGTGDERGSGFGMPLVKRYLDMMFGTMDIDSTTSAENREHSGTRITLRFPTTGARD